MSDPRTQRITFRAPRGLRERMSVIGSFYGGGTSERIRLACFLHDSEATHRWLNTPEAATELGDGLQDARDEVHRDLAEWQRLAWTRPRMNTN